MVNLDHFCILIHVNIVWRLICKIIYNVIAWVMQLHCILFCISVCTLCTGVYFNHCVRLFVDQSVRGHLVNMLITLEAHGKFGSFFHTYTFQHCLATDMQNDNNVIS